MKQLRQSKFKKGTTEYENIASPSGEVKAFRVNNVSGNLEYTTDYTNYDDVTKSSTLTGITDPTTATVGEVGQFYLNTTTNEVFICVSAGGGSYTWESIQVEPFTTQEMEAICDDIFYPALPAPTNVTASGTDISFNEVQGAESYVVYANGVEIGEVQA